MKPRVHIITLGVKDLEKSRRFYEKGLGFKASSASQDNIIFFLMEGLVLALYPHAALAEDAAVSEKGSGFRGVTLAHNVENKKDVAAVLEEAEKAGAKIVKPAQDVFWGGHSGYFSDPDGHLWEVAWNPHVPFANDGSLKLPQ
jgi:uncharacterized protein